jgi:hypothetical protein
MRLALDVFAHVRSSFRLSVDAGLYCLSFVIRQKMILTLHELPQMIL